MNNEKYENTLKCIKEILDGFNLESIYTTKQYSDALIRIDNLLQEAKI